MKFTKLFFSILLALTLFCAALLPPAFAANELIEGPYSYVIKEDGTAKITMYDKSLSGKLAIPGKIGGRTVTEIGEFAVRGDQDITEIVIPDSVKVIGYRAFAYNTALEKLTLPRQMEQIVGGAFSGCEKLSSVTLPDGLARIDNALFDHTALREIVIPEGVESIGSGAFLDCRQLESVTLPLSMKIIEEGAFNGCSALKNLHYAGTDEQYSAILIFPGGGESYNSPLLALKEQDPAVLARTPFVPCRDNVFEVPTGVTVIDYYNARTKSYIFLEGQEPPTLEKRMLIQRDLRLTGIDYETYLGISLGDIDADGQLAPSDARSVLRISIKLDQPTEIARIAADVNRDGDVTPGDARIVLRGSIGLEDPDTWKL